MESQDNAQLDFSTAQEEYLLSANTGFDEEGFDDVFYDDIQSADMESSEVSVRVRRTSDVIDCVGELSISPASTKNDDSSTTPSEVVYSAVSKATNIKELNKSRHAELTTESIDLGYSSPGAPSSSRSIKVNWFRFSSSNDADSVDAHPIENSFNQETPATSTTNNDFISEAVRRSTNAANMPVVRDATCYNMDHEYRGMAVIINNDIFESTTGLGPRNGSWKDVEDLKTMFYRLDFSVVVWNNLFQLQLLKYLHELSQENHTQNDCIVVVLLTHGISSTYVYARDNPYNVALLWDSFTPDKCPTLAGKPKLFFLQACRGVKLDSGIVLSRETSTEVDSSTAAYKIPLHADFLINFSTYNGYYSFRSPEEGTWFIQSLCAEVNKHDLASIDFLRIMTRVSRRVALENESYSPELPWLHQQKQIPSIHSMLIRDLFFKPKKKPAPEPIIITE